MAITVLKKIRERLYRLLFRLLVCFLPKVDGPPEAGAVRQILIYSDMGIGNFLMFTPMLRAFRRGFPQAEIVCAFFKNRNSYTVELPEGLIDRKVFISAPSTLNLKGYLQTKKQVRELRIAPDMIIGRCYPHFFYPLITLVTRPAYRVGHVSGAGFTGFCDAVFNFPVIMRREEHEIDRYLNLSRAVGLNDEDRSMEVWVAPDSRETVKKYLQERGMGQSRPLVCVQPGASMIQPWKRWNMDRWARLCRLLTASGCDVLILGSKEERPVLKSLVTTATSESGARMHVAAGELDFNQACAVLEVCDLLYCNDSSLMHVRSAFDKPMIVFFGPTDYDRTRPLSEHSVLLRRECECNTGTLYDLKTVKRILKCTRPCLATSVEDALEAGRKLLPDMEISHADFGMVDHTAPCPVCNSRRSESLFKFDFTKWNVDKELQLQRCDECGLLFSWPRMTEEELGALYGPGYYIFRRSEEESIERMVPIYERTLLPLERDELVGEFLDIGCSKGFFPALARRRGWKPFGVELSEHASQCARELFELDVFNGSIEEYAGCGKQFPVVTAIDVLEHVPDPAGFLEAIAQVCEPGARLILDTPNGNAFHINVFGGTWRGFNPFHIIVFNEDNLGRLLRSKGFEVENSFSYNNAFPSIKGAPFESRGESVEKALTRAAKRVGCDKGLLEEDDADKPLAANRLGENLVVIARYTGRNESL